QETRDRVVSTSKPVPEADERRITTQDFEDAPTVRSSNNPEIVAKPVEEPITSNDHSQPEENKEPIVNQNAFYKGSQSDGRGGGDDANDKAGNQGAKPATTLAGSYEGAGYGGGGSAPNQAGPYFTTRPVLQEDGQTEGRLTLQITLHRRGNVKAATAG